MDLTFTPQTMVLPGARTNGTVAQAAVFSAGSPGLSGTGGGQDADPTGHGRVLWSDRRAAAGARHSGGAERQGDTARAQRQNRQSQGETARLMARMDHLGRALSRLLAAQANPPTQGASATGSTRQVLVADSSALGGALIRSIGPWGMRGVQSEYPAHLSQRPAVSPVVPDVVTLSTDPVQRVAVASDDTAQALAQPVVSDLALGGGAALTVQAGMVTHLSTTATDASTGAGADAVAIVAGLVQDIVTGAGNDAIALQANLVTGLDAGAGDDAVAVQSALVSGIAGGAGEDVLSVDTVIGLASAPTGTPWQSLAELGVAARLAGWADRGVQVDGGDGADTLSLRVGVGLGVAGGLGDDRITVTGGTVAIGYQAGDGHDRVTLAAGAEAVLQLGPGVVDYRVRRDGNALIVSIGTGSVRFDGLANAGAIGIRTMQGDVVMLHQAAATPLDRVV